MFFEQFGLLFSNMAWYVIVCLIVGIICLIIEGIQPGFGFFGVTGLTLLVLSIVLRAVFHQPEDNVLVQVFQFVLLDAVLFVILLTLLIVAQKKGWLKKTPFYLADTAVDEKFSDGTKNYSFLLGKTGETVTVLRPSGKAEIDGKIYDVESADFLVEKGEKIEVTALEGAVIKVKKIEQ